MLAGKGSSWKILKIKGWKPWIFAQQWVSFSPQKVRLFLGIPMYFPVGMMMFPRRQFHPWKIPQVGHDDVVRRPGAFCGRFFLKLFCLLNPRWCYNSTHKNWGLRGLGRGVTLSRGSTKNWSRKKHLERRHCWSFRNDTETRIHVEFP